MYEFKTSLSEIFNTDSKIHYYYGQRWANVHHSRMRIGCSGLNYDLHTNLHVINSPSCRCGAPQETANHYFMECILYDDQRLELRDVVSAICPFEFKTNSKPLFQRSSILIHTITMDNAGLMYITQECELGVVD